MILGVFPALQQLIRQKRGIHVFSSSEGRPAISGVHHRDSYTLVIDVKSNAVSPLLIYTSGLPTCSIQIYYFYAVEHQTKRASYSPALK